MAARLLWLPKTSALMFALRANAVKPVTAILLLFSLGLSVAAASAAVAAAQPPLGVDGNHLHSVEVGPGAPLIRREPGHDADTRGRVGVHRYGEHHDHQSASSDVFAQFDDALIEEESADDEDGEAFGEEQHDLSDEVLEQKPFQAGVVVPTWYLAEPGENCEHVCNLNGLSCNLEAMKAMALARSNEAIDKLSVIGLAQGYCKITRALDEDCPEESCSFPGVFPDGDCRAYGYSDMQAEQITCDAAKTDDDSFRRLCACKFEREPSKCVEPLVGANSSKVLPDARITASSSWDLQCAASLSRADVTGDYSWMPKVDDSTQWIQWHFEELKKISKIMTKGSPTEDYWVESYRLRYSEDDGQTWEWHPEELVGNMDRNSWSYNNIVPPIIATTVRLHPQTWRLAIALRVELYGCVGDHVPRGHWKHCADEGGLCRCKGIVWFGSRRRHAACNGELDEGTCSGTWERVENKRWHYKESEGAIQCTATDFGLTQDLSDQRAEIALGVTGRFTWHVLAKETADLNGYFEEGLGSLRHVGTPVNRTFRIEWNGRYMVFEVGRDFFVDRPNRSRHEEAEDNDLFNLTNFFTDDQKLENWVNDAGGACLCLSNRAALDTAWAILPIDNEHWDHGCSGAGWRGRGAYYAGRQHGGGWVGVKDDTEPKAGLDVTVGMRILMLETKAKRSCGCDEGSDWTSEHCTNRRRGATTKEYETPGAVGRRRWCGYGARDCEWNSWSNFSACEEATWKTRTRVLMLAEKNGGTCHGTALQNVSCWNNETLALEGCFGGCTKYLDYRRRYVQATPSNHNEGDPRQLTDEEVTDEERRLEKETVQTPHTNEANAAE